MFGSSAAARGMDEIFLLQCSYMAKDGRRCTETVGLQYDHIRPFANGGEQTVETLRLVCCSHNQLLAEMQFGKNFMQGKRKQ